MHINWRIHDSMDHPFLCRIVYANNESKTPIFATVMQEEAVHDSEL